MYGDATADIDPAPASTSPTTSTPRSAAARRAAYNFARQDQLRRDPGAPGPADDPGPAGRRRRSPGLLRPGRQRLQQQRADHRRVGEVDVEVQRQQDRGRGRRRLAPRHVQRRLARPDARTTTCRSSSLLDGNLGIWGPGFGASRDATNATRLQRRRPVDRRTRTRSSRTARWTPPPYCIGGPGSICRRRRAAPRGQAHGHPARQGRGQPRDQGRHRRRGQPLGQGARCSRAALHRRTTSATSRRVNGGSTSTAGSSSPHDGQHRPALRQHLPHAEPVGEHRHRRLGHAAVQVRLPRRHRRARRAPRSPATPSTGRRTSATRGRSSRT